ncbi:MAG: hypothetical protein M3O36_13710 [Myxococcota bacterium]|nr:hypothetical protein [Myxococcota bacterium]
MFSIKRFSGASSLAIASLLADGCATQSSAFHHMSAADQDTAATAPQGDPTLASEHAAAAQRLRETERSACVGVPDAERVEGPFARKERIAGVTVIRDRPFPKGMEQSVGVAVYLRAEPGMTQQWLGRVTECHLAHHAVAGRLENDHCPLSFDDAKVNVSSTPDGFRLAITSRDSDVARSVIASGQELLGKGSARLARE